jgi:NTE family protein
MLKTEASTGPAEPGSRPILKPGGHERRTPGPGGEERILVLQGGGALGAYQAGVYEALSGQGYEPDWLAGISIGAINAALIAGNPPERRVERLREFWLTVSSGPAPQMLFPIEPLRAHVNAGAAAMAAIFGAPGLFAPRLGGSVWQPPGDVAGLGVYDTSPLRRTLERLVDFERINGAGTRLSVGAVNVRTGNFAYFDSARQRLDPRHIMASAALPPGFPPVEIDGEYYWDGGLVSNAPLQYVLDQPWGLKRRLVFQVDLFPARGELPSNLDEARARAMDIRYSSRTRLSTDQELQLTAIAQAARRLTAKLPPELVDDPDVRRLVALGSWRDGLDIVHLIYRCRGYESFAKDYEFSRLSMLEHWDAGRDEGRLTLSDPRWMSRDPTHQGARVFDLGNDPLLT